MRYNLPDQKLIAKRQKTADTISISSQGFYGEDDFRCQRLKEGGNPEETAGILQAEKY